MPWTCESCKTLVPRDDVVACPGCARTKEAWSFVAARTRAMVVSAKKFDLMTGVDAAPLPPGDGAWKDIDVVPAQVAWAMPRAEARALAERGFMPPPNRLLVVLLVPKGAKDLTVKVAVEFETREVEELALPRELSPSPDVFDVPLLLVAGADDGHELPAFQGVHVLDVTEDTELGHAPTLEVVALKRPPKRVPISLGVAPRLVHDASGEPVAHVYVALGREQDGRVVVDERCVTREDGLLGVPADGPGWQTRPPEAEARRPEGQVVRLHWAYGFETDEELAALPKRAWSEVTIGPEVRLRPSRPRGRLHVRVLAGDPPAPLADAPCRLNGPHDLELAPVEVTTDADGVITLEDLEQGLWRLETPQGHARVEPRPGAEQPIEVLAEPEEDPSSDEGAERALAVAPHDGVVDEPDDDAAPAQPDDDPDDGPLPEHTEQEGGVGLLNEELFALLRGTGGDQ